LGSCRLTAPDDQLGGAVDGSDFHGDGPTESLQQCGDAEGDSSCLGLAAGVGGDRELDDGLACFPGSLADSMVTASRIRWLDAARRRRQSRLLRR
jgi:hypothetical protein